MNCTMLLITMSSQSPVKFLALVCLLRWRYPHTTDWESFVLWPTWAGLLDSEEDWMAMERNSWMMYPLPLLSFDGDTFSGAETSDSLPSFSRQRLQTTWPESFDGLSRQCALGWKSSSKKRALSKLVGYSSTSPKAMKCSLQKSIVCLKCMHRNPKGSKFCNECGQHFGTCPRCTHGNPQGAKFCNQCGQHQAFYASRNGTF